MAINNLYNNMLTRSDECFDKALAEIGGVEAIAPLWLVQEERSKMVEGEKVYGRVREGIICIPSNYILNSQPIRAITPIGLPLIDPEKATQANGEGRFYSLDANEYAEKILSSFKSLVTINERDVRDNCLELKLNKFVSEYTLPLFGGEGSRQEKVDRVERAGLYFRKELDKAGKSRTKSIRLYLPPFVSEDIIGTQILACGLGLGFNLYGDSRGLGLADGVFGVLNKTGEASSQNSK